MKTILVLEANISRINWLSSQVDQDTEIVVADNVEEFLELFEYETAPTMVILGHDLGGFPERLEHGSTDAAGKTGMVAAHHMRKVSCPVVVWSFNTAAAQAMVTVLRRRGFRASWAPYKSKEFLRWLEVL